MKYTIAKDKLVQFVESQSDYELYAPTLEKNGELTFAQIQNGRKIELNFSNTARSPKYLFLPTTDTLMTYEMDSKGFKGATQTPVPTTKRIIFGIRPCDTEAITIMKKLFRSEDVFLNARINNTVLITLNCNTACSENCFCQSVNYGPFAQNNFDIALTDLGNNYLVDVATPKGEKLIKKLKMNVVASSDEENQKKLKVGAEKSIKIQFKADGIEKKLTASDPRWRTKGKACMRCGGCNYICPTCVCFNVVDRANKRSRCWDSCLMSGFTVMAGGENPREELSDRIIQRYFHKFKYTKEVDNYYSCVGCGRCSKVCLFNDNMGANLKEINS